ncbi:hypothetical protein RRG08_013382, partial [Elysia crispata]
MRFPKPGKAEPVGFKTFVNCWVKAAVRSPSDSLWTSMRVAVGFERP